MSASFATPLRYPGGKGRLGHWFSKLLTQNNLEGCHFIEPYAGGAGSAIYLLLNEKVASITINDVDPAIYSIWWSILNDSDNFINKIELADLSIDEWHRQRSIVTNSQNHTLSELGFAAFYQNRTNRSGIIKGGVIGGLKQSGKYKLDARFNKAGLINRVEKIISYKKMINLSMLDAKALLENCINNKKTNNFIYLDPPYFNKGGQLYRNYYNKEDHQEIASLVGKLTCPWVVTYDDCTEINKLYHWAHTSNFSMKYSTHTSRPDGHEVCFTGNLPLNTSIYLKR